ncbi:MAG: WbqC family protein [Bacteroidales bacterium]|nr:WbqC family protein [Bacteroidales bacterium]MDD3960407.1 WbqC family protein [Bacteroidales bacterium]MDY0285860.1 WbqC family protein [Bacteroidales bacterium]HPE86088.1 WbqC family protein [Bacteroidales bacterium]
MENYTVFSTAAFPPVSYMVCILLAEKPLIDLGENFVKQTFRNRYRIGTSSGVQSLSLPVIKTEGHHTPVNKMVLSEQMPWRRTQWRTLEAAYRNSPFFIHYQDQVKKLLFNPSHHLHTYNKAVFHGLCHLMGLTHSLEYHEQFFNKAGYDLRNSIHPKKSNPLTQIIMEHPYHQVFEEKTGFLPDLSLVDVLFNLGPESRTYIQALASYYLSASAGYSIRT